MHGGEFYNGYELETMDCTFTYRENGVINNPETGGKKRALVLFSGGLDSMLAVELLRRCGVEVSGITFTTPFFASAKAKKAAGELGIELLVVDITGPHLEMLKHPRYGYGKNMNPCIDCHALMVRVAMERLQDLGADFIATGEVTGGEAKEPEPPGLGAGGTGPRGRVTSCCDPSRQSCCRRRSRSWRDGWTANACSTCPDVPGIARWTWRMNGAIGEYENPAGGCLLTDAAFSARLRELMVRVPGFDGTDAELAKVGRHNWTGSTLIVLGRRHEENLRLMEIALPTDLLLREREVPGPTALLRAYPRGASPNRKDIKETARLLGIYGKGKKPLKPDMIVEIEPEQGGDGDTITVS